MLQVFFCEEIFHFRKVSRLFQECGPMSRKRTSYIYNGIVFEGLNSENNTIFDFIVYDLGVLDDRRIKGVVNSDIRIVCSGDKPQEILFLNNVKEELKNTEFNICILSSQSYRSGNSYYVQYVEDISSKSYDEKVFEEIITSYLKG